MIDRYPNVAGQLLALRSSDDAFATESGQGRLLSLFPGVVPRSVVFEPTKFGVTRIGHFGYFRRGLETVIWHRLAHYVQTGDLADE